MTTTRTKTSRERMLGHLLESIVLANGGTVQSMDTNSLLESWLTAIGG
jgi:hypothetical protein